MYDSLIRSTRCHTVTIASTQLSKVHSPCRSSSKEFWYFRKNSIDFQKCKSSYYSDNHTALKGQHNVCLGVLTVTPQYFFKYSLLDDTCGYSTTCFDLKIPSSGATRIYNIKEYWHVKTFLELRLKLLVFKRLKCIKSVHIKSKCYRRSLGLSFCDICT
jgi:hypothetical protein